MPANLPCSFEYKHGHVRYEVKAILGQPQKVDKCTKRAFTVLRKLDLNDVDNARESVEVQNETKVTTVGCFPAGLINVTMGMDKKGYVPGEVVAPKINLNNASNRNVTVTVELEELIKLHGSRTGHQGPGNVELEGIMINFLYLLCNFVFFNITTMTSSNNDISAQLRDNG